MDGYLLLQRCQDASNTLERKIAGLPAPAKMHSISLEVKYRHLLISHHIPFPVPVISRFKTKTIRRWFNPAPDRRSCSSCAYCPSSISPIPNCGLFCFRLWWPRVTRTMRIVESSNRICRVSCWPILSKRMSWRRKGKSLVLRC